jgi:1,4-alpha-glucan branching enzyme
MLYLDYGRSAGEWVANRYGGRENLEAIDFLRNFNTALFDAYPDCHTIAEESDLLAIGVAPCVRRRFGFRFEVGHGLDARHPCLFRPDPIHRKYHHEKLTFRMLYASHENFVLPLSHDEVVYGKRSLLSKMPGDEWQRFANLRLLFGYMYGQQGKKLLFMGAELGQAREWVHDDELDWELLDKPMHAGMARWLSDLNALYAGQLALHQRDCQPAGLSGSTAMMPRRASSALCAAAPIH